MSNYAHQTAPTQFVEAAGVRFAYRRFANWRSNDVIVYTVNSFFLQKNLPNAELILYPDANHGLQYQYPKLFLEHATLFLNG